MAKSKKRAASKVTTKEKPAFYLANVGAMTLDDVNKLYAQLTGKTLTEEEKAEGQDFFDKHIRGDVPYESRANPYRDKDGQFCSEAEAVMTIGEPGEKKVGDPTVDANDVPGTVADINEIFKRLKETDGFTFHVASESCPTKGYAFSVNPELTRKIPADKITKLDLLKFIAGNKQFIAGDKTRYFGAWLSEGQVYLDVAHVGSNRNEAERLGKKFNQISAWDLENMVEIKLNGTGEALDEYHDGDRAAPLLPELPIKFTDERQAYAYARDAIKSKRLQRAFYTQVEARGSGVAGEGRIKATINTNSVDRYRTIVAPNGAVLDNFLRNPVLLWAHGLDWQQGTIPVGTVPVIDARNGSLEVEVEFDVESDLGAELDRMYRKKILRGFSIGFQPIDADIVVVEGESIIRYTKWELVELSAVSVPANPDALARSISTGEILPMNEPARELLLAACRDAELHPTPTPPAAPEEATKPAEKPQEAAPAPVAATPAPEPAKEPDAAEIATNFEGVSAQLDSLRALIAQLTLTRGGKTFSKTTKTSLTQHADDVETHMSAVATHCGEVLKRVEAVGECCKKLRELFAERPDQEQDDEDDLPVGGKQPMGKKPHVEERVEQQIIESGERAAGVSGGESRVGGLKGEPQFLTFRLSDIISPSEVRKIVSDTIAGRSA